MTRNGKIARLPHSLRDELNQRLLDGGETGAQLIAWLNARDDVQAVLAQHFIGRPITEDNLSEWRMGGFEDWCRYQDARAWIRDLADKSANLQLDAERISVADWLSTPLAVALGKCIHNIASAEHQDLAAHKNLLALSRELSQLRRGDHQQQSLRFQREKWEAQRAESE